MDYAIEYGEKAIEDLDALDRPIARRIIRIIRQKLTTSPLEYGTRFKYYQDLYKLRIGDYRVIYKVDTERQKVFILVIGNRNKIYEILRKRLG
ncbi:MAG TPA: type II toxin-antitoxin system RelE family toxin [Candidatus Hypogeohydataceae bacterium YC41]